ncbi:hypothetical protein [Mesoterricola silvestris]|uniref:Outer membrane protein beta-barrel domain-containing protein n=1 Tax=Mesoterricola silvestris TaxID=2927979 RepID=A0AA48GLS9_9BACT|nr:hypothetical protein [Mesoterricola silvestris]BDU72164.1 hypothetical protein METEAL_13380 [Mesoterricola silvestris]
MNMEKLVTAALLGLAAFLPARVFGQDTTHLQIKAGLALTSMGQLHGMTGKASAPSFEGACYLPNAGNLGLDLVPYVGTFRISGADSTATGPEYYTVSAWRFGLDMVWYRGKIAGTPVAFRTGPALHSFIGQSTLSQTNSLTNKQWKLGWRAGFDVAITSTWFASLELTASEWRSESSQAKKQNINPNNPVYAGIMVGYRL